MVALPAVVEVGVNAFVHANEGTMKSLIGRIDHVIRPRGRVFHGWWLVSGAAGIQLLSASLWMQSFGAYAVLLQADFGWSNALIAGAFSLTRMESGILGPLQGWLVDRFGPRPILRIGLVVFAAGFLLFATIDSILMFYLTWALIAVGSSLGGFQTLTVAIVNWFDHHRAKAVAVSQLGFSLGGLCVPIVILSLELLGWRGTAVAAGIAVLIIGLPLVQLVHHRPDAKGEVPDGTIDPHPAVAGRQRTNDRDLTPVEAMRTSAFWKISIGHALALLTVSTVMAHLVPHLKAGLDFSLREAGLVVALMTSCQMAGQLLGGWLGDRFEKRLVCIGCMLAHALGFMMLAFASNSTMVVGFALLHGLGWGGARAAHGGAAGRLLRCRVVRHHHGLLVADRDAGHDRGAPDLRLHGRLHRQLRGRLRCAGKRLGGRGGAVRNR